MQTLAEVVYQKFFLRDVLGKITPGGVVCVALCSILAVDVGDLLVSWERLGWLVSLIALAVWYLVGVALQVAGELLGVLSASPRPHHIFFLPVGLLKRWPLFEQWWQMNEDAAERGFRIQSAPEEVLPATFREQREYVSALKEGTGNLSLALLVVLGAVWVSEEETWLTTTVLVVLMGFLWSGQLLFAKRQARFEMSTLTRIGILSVNEAQAIGKQVGLRKPPAERIPRENPVTL